MPDYMYMLESRLSPEQRAAIMRMQELGTETGTNVYLTGGAVRDLLAGMIVRDLDFTVEGNPARLARELEKGGARIVREDEKNRQIELVFSGDVDGSISAAREDIYARPGTKPEIRWSTIMEDLRGRDFSINAIAISLNPNSRGLLLDPTNGLADLEKTEVRALSIHSFTNQPVRLLRAIRYAARMGFKLESRTEEWFALAMERKLQDNIAGEEAGRELHQLGREDKPVAILKAWESRALIGTRHPQLARRHPDYDALNRLMKSRDDLLAAGLRPRLAVPVTYAVLGRLKSREAAATLHRLEYRSQEIDAIQHFEAEAQKVVKLLAGKKTAAPGDAFAYLATAPAEILTFILAESSNSKALGKIRNYLHKWKPLRQALPAAVNDLEMLGFPSGPKFNKIIEEFFRLQLAGKGRTPEDRIKVLRKLSGIKEPPPKKEEKKKVPAKKAGGAKDKAAVPAAPAEAAPAKGAKAAADAAASHKAPAAAAGKKAKPAKAAKPVKQKAAPKQSKPKKKKR